MSDTYVDVIRSAESGEFRAELREVNTDRLILAQDWRKKREHAVADARALRNDDDKLAAAIKADTLRGGMIPILRDRGDVGEV